jgi:hypothetical protein
MLKKFDVAQTESFLKGLKVLTGIPYRNLEMYANENGQIRFKFEFLLDAYLII